MLGRKIDYLAPAISVVDLVLMGYVFLTIATQTAALKRRALWLTLGTTLITFLYFTFVSHSIISFYFGWQILEFVLFSWAVAANRTHWLDCVIPLALAVTLQTFLAAAQFLRQGSLGGLTYWLGERSFSSTTVGIAQFSVQGRLLLRPYGTFPHPNVLGGFFLVSVVLIMSDLMHRQKQVRLFKQMPLRYLLLLAGTSLGVVGIFLSFSRSAWLIGLLLIGGYVIKNLTPKLAYAGVLLLIFIVTLEEIFISRLTSSLVWDTAPLIQRAELWRAAKSMLHTSPFFGVGPGMFIKNLPTFAPQTRLLQPVHSIYALVMSETGIVGFVLLLMLVAYTSLKGFVKKRWPVLISFFILLGLGIFDHYVITLSQTRLLLALITGLLYA